MIYYFGYPIGKNMGDDAVFRSFVLCLNPEYRKLVKTVPDGCKIAVLGGGSLVTNQEECGFKYFLKTLEDHGIKSTFVFGTGYDSFDNGENYDWSDQVRGSFKEEDCFWRGVLTQEKMKTGTVSGDPALLDDLLLGATRYEEYGEFDCGLSYGRSDGRYTPEYIRDFLKEKIRNKKSVLLPVCLEDKIIMRSHFPNIPCMEVLPFPEYVRFIKERVGFMYSMKLHSTIAAFKSGKEYYSFNYRLKCDDFELSKGINNIGIMRRRLNERIRDLEIA